MAQAVVLRRGANVGAYNYDVMIQSFTLDEGKSVIMLKIEANRCMSDS